MRLGDISNFSKAGVSECWLFPVTSGCNLVNCKQPWGFFVVVFFFPCCRNTDWSSSQMEHRTETSVTSPSPQGSPWSPRRLLSCWSRSEKDHWVSSAKKWHGLLSFNEHIYGQTGQMSWGFPQLGQKMEPTLKSPDSKRLRFNTFSSLLRRCQATEIGRRERRTVGSDKEVEESAGGGETETFKDGQSVHGWGEDGKWNRSSLYWDAE